jgi:hypothetical protein
MNGREASWYGLDAESDDDVTDGLGDGPPAAATVAMQPRVLHGPRKIPKAMVWSPPPTFPGFVSGHHILCLVVATAVVMMVRSRSAHHLPSAHHPEDLQGDDAFVLDLEVPAAPLPGVNIVSATCSSACSGSCWHVYDWRAPLLEDLSTTELVPVAIQLPHKLHTPPTTAPSTALFPFAPFLQTSPPPLLASASIQAIVYPMTLYHNTHPPRLEAVRWTLPFPNLPLLIVVVDEQQPHPATNPGPFWFPPTPTRPIYSMALYRAPHAPPRMHPASHSLRSVGSIPFPPHVIQATWYARLHRTTLEARPQSPIDPDHHQTSGDGKEQDRMCRPSQLVAFTQKQCKGISMARQAALLQKKQCHQSTRFPSCLIPPWCSAPQLLADFVRLQRARNTQCSLKDIDSIAVPVMVGTPVISPAAPVQPTFMPPPQPHPLPMPAKTTTTAATALMDDPSVSNTMLAVAPRPSPSRTKTSSRPRLRINVFGFEINFTVNI